MIGNDLSWLLWLLLFFSRVGVDGVMSPYFSSSLSRGGVVGAKAAAAGDEMPYFSTMSLRAVLVAGCCCSGWLACPRFGFSPRVSSCPSVGEKMEGTLDSDLSALFRAKLETAVLILACLGTI